MNLSGHRKFCGDSRHRCPGFSLLELVIVMAVVSILLALAIPAYQRYTQRVHRAEAIRVMMAIADCQERVRASTGFYDTSRCGEGRGNVSHNFWIEPSESPGALAFTIIADPRRNREDYCGRLSLDQAGTRGISGKPQDLGKCWGGR
jgi:type IV pilus assembly protein PilE